jgi:hypothetical protein
MKASDRIEQPKVRMTLWLPKPLMDRLKWSAFRKDTDASKVIGQLIEEHLPPMPNFNKLKLPPP